MSADGALCYEEIVCLGNLFTKSRDLDADAGISSKAFGGMELIRTVMTHHVREVASSAGFTKKTVKRKKCRVMEFICLCLPSQIWVKQTQPTKQGTKLSQLNTR